MACCDPGALQRLCARRRPGRLFAWSRWRRNAAQHVLPRVECHVLNPASCAVLLLAQRFTCHVLMGLPLFSICLFRLALAVTLFGVTTAQIRIWLDDWTMNAQLFQVLVVTEAIASLVKHVCCPSTRTCLASQLSVCLVVSSNKDFCSLSKRSVDPSQCLTHSRHARSYFRQFTRSMTGLRQGGAMSFIF